MSGDRKFMRFSLIRTDEKLDETRTTDRKTPGGIMVLRSNLAVGGDSSCHLHQEIWEEAENTHVTVSSLNSFRRKMERKRHTFFSCRDYASD